jgi:hypothetical protein
LLAIAVGQCIFYLLKGRVRQQAGSYGFCVGFWMCGVSGVFATVVTSDCSYRGFAVDAVLRGGGNCGNSLVVQTLGCRAANTIPVGVSLLAIAVGQRR